MSFLRGRSFLRGFESSSSVIGNGAGGGGGVLSWRRRGNLNNNINNNSSKITNHDHDEEEEDIINSSTSRTGLSSSMEDEALLVSLDLYMPCMETKKKGKLGGRGLGHDERIVGTTSSRSEPRPIPTTSVPAAGGSSSASSSPSSTTGGGGVAAAASSSSSSSRAGLGKQQQQQQQASPPSVTVWVSNEEANNNYNESGESKSRNNAAAGEGGIGPSTLSFATSGLGLDEVDAELMKLELFESDAASLLCRANERLASLSAHQRTSLMMGGGGSTCGPPAETASVYSLYSHGSRRKRGHRHHAAAAGASDNNTTTNDDLVFNTFFPGERGDILSWGEEPDSVLLDRFIAGTVAAVDGETYGISSSSKKISADRTTTTATATPPLPFSDAALLPVSPYLRVDDNDIESDGEEAKSDSPGQSRRKSRKNRAAPHLVLSRTAVSQGTLSGNSTSSSLSLDTPLHFIPKYLPSQGEAENEDESVVQPTMVKASTVGPEAFKRSDTVSSIASSISDSTSVRSGSVKQGGGGVNSSSGRRGSSSSKSVGNINSSLINSSSGMNPQFVSHRPSSISGRSTTSTSTAVSAQQQQQQLQQQYSHLLPPPHPHSVSSPSPHTPTFSRRRVPPISTDFPPYNNTSNTNTFSATGSSKRPYSPSLSLTTATVASVSSAGVGAGRGGGGGGGGAATVISTTGGGGYYCSSSASVAGRGTVASDHSMPCGTVVSGGGGFGCEGDFLILVEMEKMRAELDKYEFANQNLQGSLQQMNERLVLAHKVEEELIQKLEEKKKNSKSKLLREEEEEEQRDG